MLKNALSIGMDVTLAGGVDKVKGLSIKEIRALSLEVRRRGGRLDAAHHARKLAFSEGLEYDALSDEKKDEFVSRVMQGLGHLGAEENGRRLAHSEGQDYDALSDKKKKEYVSRAMQGLGHLGTEAGHETSIVSRADAALSLHDRMYDRVQLNAQQTKYAADAEAWFKSVQSRVAGVRGTKARSQALAKLGILGSQDQKDMNRLFKQSSGWEKAPDTKNLLARSRHQEKIENARMEYIQKTPLKSQMKRKVSTDTGEMERLLTVLYHDLSEKSYSDGR